MIEIKGHIVDTWWIMKSVDETIIRSGLVTVGSQVQSGLSNKEVFTVEINWANRLLDFNITGDTSENITLSGGTWVVV
jgi:hypothetical protein